ncbi:hypothetical protein Ancab_039750 [Ancistrocladus abbreviatus]
MGTLEVPNVQELVKEKVMTKIPERYIVRSHDEQKSPKVDFVPQLPVIDMARLTSPEFMDSELEKMDRVCKEWGFFQLINHGVTTSLVEKIEKEIEGFFNLPLNEKNKYKQHPGESEGFGQLFVLSEEQKLDWGDMLYMVTLPPHLRKPHLLPQLPLTFRETVETYSAELRKLALKLLDCMAKALKMDANDMRLLFEEGKQEMKMNYYPSCPQPELVMGLTAHSDATGLTILRQTNEVEGLQVKKDGKWIPVRPLHDAFIINIGDILEVVTNGIYRSIEHRAVVNAEKERMSLATFHSPKLDGEMGPAPSLVTPQTPALFKRIIVADYFKEYFARKLDGKSYLECMRIQKGETETN